jgi:hypothetical protein
MKTKERLSFCYYAIACLLTLSACNELDIQPAGFITTDRFYRTEADAVAGLAGVYSALSIEDGAEQSLYGRNLYFLTDMGSDYAAAGQSAINPNVRSISAASVAANNDRVELAWKQIYRAINRANVAIDKIPGVSGSQEVKERLVNEARFLRALLYFDAVQLWGDIPLVLHEAESLDKSVLLTARTPKEEVYRQIIADLTAAESLPPNSAVVKGHASRGSATALLSKVYLVRGEWEQAAAKALEVINSREYSLFPNFADVFNPRTKNGREHIFSVQFEIGLRGSAGNTGNTLPGAAFPGFVPNEPADIISDVRLFYEELFEEGDVRRDVSFAKRLYNPATGAFFEFPKPLFRKFVDTTLIAAGQSQAASTVNNPLVRYADVLLAYAEAVNEQSAATPSAYDALNQVRRRAFGLPIDAPSTVDYANLSKEAFREAIKTERFREFIQEGKRWFDLVRWGDLVDALHKVKEKAGATNRNYLYPIPLAQHDLNPEGLWQNEGY